MQIFERDSFEKVIFGGKMRREREISHINGRNRGYAELLYLCAVSSEE